ncbi:unnamed protein product [Brachionus calyciflorus]|uniref:Reverse transcriptase domain-containing protein n=1 Tax=Brachionus calyciflorus TaxID=104777 RepID=A0A813PIU0_9BILA|nr:unnamed protein product [Brachionus calyciflorus]
MPMGIKTAPAWFQRFIEKTFIKLIMENKLGAYLDDTIVFTNSKKHGLDYHVETVEEVVDTLKERNLKISYEKSVALVEEVELLGNTISKNKLKPNSKRAKCLELRKIPKRLKNYNHGLMLPIIIDG